MTMPPMTILPGSTNSASNGSTTQQSPEAPVSALSAEDEQKIIAWVSEQYDKIKSARSAVERQWYVNLSFFYGRQNVVVTPVAGNTIRLHIPKAPYWRSRVVINKVRAVVRKIVAKLTAQKPNVYVIPASTEEKDLFAAQAGEQVWESIFRRKKISRLLRRACWWTTITGNGFLKVWWDPQDIDVDSQQMGDINISVETPFHVFVPDLREPDLQAQPYVIHASVKTVDWVQMRYGHLLEGKQINPNVTTENDILEASFLNLVSAASTEKDGVLCLECWVKPGQLTMFPNGGMYTVVGNVLVQAVEGLPFLHGNFPFIKFSFIDSGKFYADSVITDFISLQREYNRTHNQIIEAKNLMAKPKLMGHEGAVDPKKITSEPGQYIPVGLGMQFPTILPMPEIPGYVREELDRLQHDMDDIVGQHEISKGQTPPGVTAATAISYLQEQDDTMLSDAMSDLEGGIEELGHQILSLVVQYWETERIVKTTGQNQSFDVAMLQGSTLSGNTDLRVESGSALPTSRAAKQAFIMDLMKMGFVDPNKGLELLEIGGVQKLYEDVQRDKTQASRENLRMANLTEEMIRQHVEMMTMDQDVNPATGEPIQIPPIVPVNTWDEHMIHIDVHNGFRKTQQFEALPDFVRNIFEEHVQMHVLAMAGAFSSDAATDEAATETESSGLPMGEEESGPPPGPEPAPETEEVDIGGMEING